MKKLVFGLVFVVFSATPSHAACENFLNGFRVINGFPGGNPSESVYYMVAAEHLGLQATIGAYFDKCTSVECKEMLDTFYRAYWSRRMVKFGVTEYVCKHLDQYTMMINGGGSCDVLPIQLITSVLDDGNYPF